MKSSNSVRKKLWAVLVFASGLFLVQLIGGMLSGSLALLADSFHILVDVIAIAISVIAFRLSKKPHSSKLSFGFHRVEVLAAFVNGILLIVLSIFVAYESYRRFLEPPEIKPVTLIIFATLGLAGNFVMAYILHKESKSNLNVKGAYVHVLGDLASSIGVVAVGITLYFVNLTILDVIVSVGITVLILKSGISLCKNCIHVFLEGTPSEIQHADILRELESMDEISEIHDLHIWTLTSNLFAMSVHVKVRQELLEQSNVILRKIQSSMYEKFGITHCTIQVEGLDDLINP